jgi:hypothetical protein
MKVASGGKACDPHSVEADPALSKRINVNVGFGDRKRNKPSHHQRLQNREPVAAAHGVDVHSLTERVPRSPRAADLPVVLFASVAGIDPERNPRELPRYIQLVDEALVHVTRPAARARKLFSCEVFALRFHLLAP